MNNKQLSALKFYGTLLFFIVFSSAFSQNANDIRILDSIYKLRALSKDINYELNNRIRYAETAIELSSKLNYDSTLLKSKRALSFVYLMNDKLEDLKEINFENFKLAEKINDSSAMANADYILGYVYGRNVNYDSAYYHYYNAVKIYKETNNYASSGEVLLNMANIQETERDYIGAEANAIASTKFIQKLKETDRNLQTLWSANNVIGIVSGKLKLYDNALKYHNVAYEYADKMEDGYYYKILTNSNIASTYRKKGEYNIAINKYNEILENKNLIAYDSSSYASTISNIAHTKFLNGISNKKEIEIPFREAISIAKAINDNSTEIYTYYYLGKYFENIKQNDSAIKYTNKALKKAKTTKTNDILLESLILKSSLVKDSSDYFFKYHTRVNDSLILAERSIRNKFARIENETETFKQETEIVSRQNLWLIVASSTLAAMLFLVYIIKTRRERQKELELQQQQQLANEEIYNLMLSQQDRMDEARSVEKKRISQEIHDGILGRLFGVRLNLDNLNLVKTEDAITSRSNYINELKEIEVDIRKVSHDLNTDFVSNSSFSEIINTLLVTQCEAYGLAHETSIDKDINWDAISNKTRVHIYRITQETLQNIYKHAEASIATLTLEQDNNLLSLSITDDGVGYDSAKKKDGIGLKNIKSRVDDINAILSIETSKNIGTTITVEVPM